MYIDRQLMVLNRRKRDFKHKADEYGYETKAYAALLRQIQRLEEAKSQLVKLPKATKLKRRPLTPDETREQRYQRRIKQMQNPDAAREDKYMRRLERMKIAAGG